MKLSDFGFREDFKEENRIVKQDHFELDGKKYFMSTVDLGLNHQFGEGPPLYFETMIFPEGSYGELYCDRYQNRGTALESHERLLENINNGKYEMVDGYFMRKEPPNEANR